MLAEDQLDALHFPLGQVEIISLKEREFSLNNMKFPFEIQGAMNLRGKKNVFSMGAFIRKIGSVLTFEGVGKIKISGFEIEPFSSFFGVVANQDEMSLFTHCESKIVER
jgi:hypothetical protein